MATRSVKQRDNRRLRSAAMVFPTSPSSHWRPLSVRTSSGILRCGMRGNRMAGPCRNVAGCCELQADFSICCVTNRVPCRPGFRAGSPLFGRYRESAFGRVCSQDLGGERPQHVYQSSGLSPAVEIMGIVAHRPERVQTNSMADAHTLSSFSLQSLSCGWLQRPTTTVRPYTS